MNFREAVNTWREAFRKNPGLLKLPAGVELVERVHFYNEALSSGSVTTEGDSFSSKPSNSADWSFDQEGRFPYPVAIYAVGIYWKGTQADFDVVFPNTSLSIFVGNKEYPLGPACAYPAGGGANGYAATTATSTTISAVTNGLTVQNLHKIPAIGVDSATSFKARRKTKSGQTLAAASVFSWWIYCIEAREIR